jgi:transposase-like protein
MRRIELYQTMLDNSTAIIWCRSHGLLASQFKCQICDAEMKLATDGCEDGEIWRCRRIIRGERHEAKISIRRGSIFWGSNLPIRKIMFLIYEWAVNSSVTAVEYELQLDERTVLHWFETFRGIASWLVDTRLSQQIGGLNDFVEIDECQIGRRKHHRGRCPREVWLFGGVVRGSAPLSLFIQAVRKRDRATLQPIICERIHCESTIVSDGWGAYAGLQDDGFIHRVVNHSTSFVSPINGTIHTQNIENMWRCLRRFLNAKTAYSRAHLDSYIQEFVFRKAYVDAFETIVSAIEEKFTVVF